MTKATFQRILPATADDTFAWHARKGAIRRLSPAWGPGRVVKPAPLENGARAELEVAFGPTALKWIAEHQDVVVGEQFVDEQLEGPFKRWRHTHRFLSPENAATDAERPAVPVDHCLLEDAIDYAVPLGFLGESVAGGSIARDLERLFRYRHDITEADLRAARDIGALAPQKRPLTVGVTGSNGLVGGALSTYLDALGHTVIPISRAKERGGETWSAFDVPDALNGADAVVHLAGESLMGRWDDRKRAKIMDSRVKGTEALIADLQRLDAPPQTFVCASAVGFYGDRADEELTEESAPGEGFLADVVRAWEAAADGAREAGWRVAHLRFGVIFSADGGALPLMALPTQFGAGGPLGSGKQYLPAVALDDVLDIALRSLCDVRADGIINVAAPEVLRQKDVAKVLGKVLHRPSFMPAPKFALRAAVGESAEEMLFASQHVRPQRLEELEHRFRCTTVEDIVRHALGRY